MQIKASEGGIRYCYDRVFPPEKQEYCKELAENAEDSFKYWGPCSGHTVHTCSPIYITVWGKERNTLCKGIFLLYKSKTEGSTNVLLFTDIHCLALDQVKFTIGQSGAYCNSALARLSSASFLQIICMAFIAIFSFKWFSI